MKTFCKLNHIASCLVSYGALDQLHFIPYLLLPTPGSIKHIVQAIK